MTKEIETREFNGWIALLTFGGLCFGSLIMLLVGIADGDDGKIIISILSGVGFIACLKFGLFTVEPNQAIVLLLFGQYKGTEKTSGFRWTNPFYKRYLLSLRARNFDSEVLKVNDRKGNPIEISAVVVWKVEDTAKAAFDVNNYVQYVHVQAESAIRQIASRYAYDSGKDDVMCLRTSMEEISDDLRDEIQTRVSSAGIRIMEARINHLAYAPEIASAMLQRQQAEAILAARRQIVLGAVSMAQMALKHLESKDVVKLDEQGKTRMVSNLMTVLCSDRAAQPILDTTQS